MKGYLMRFAGGPLDGLTGHEQTHDWPPPDEFVVPDHSEGIYHKISQSQLPDDVAAHPNLIRGAQYEWREG